MKDTILVVNKIKILGKLTRQALEFRGYQNVIVTPSLEVAEELALTHEGPLCVILELTPSWNKQHELEFIDTLRRYQLLKPISILCTSEEVDKELTDKFLRQGVSAIIFQRFDLLNYGLELDEAINKFGAREKSKA